MVLFNCLYVDLYDIMELKGGIIWLKNPLN